LSTGRKVEIEAESVYAYSFGQCPWIVMSGSVFGKVVMKEWACIAERERDGIILWC